MAEQGLNINSSINLALPAQVPETFVNEEIRAAVRLFINTINNMLRAFEQFGGITQKDMSQWQYLQPEDTILAHQLNRLYVVAGETLGYGNFVNLYNDGGVLKARKAISNVLNRPAMGFQNVLGGATIGSFTEVIITNGLLPISGLNPGQAIYLSTTGGIAGITPDTAAGHLEQFLGYGIALNLAYVHIALGQYINH